jgi:hypothetical protein
MVGLPAAVRAIINILPAATTLDVRFGRKPIAAAVMLATDECQHSVFHAAKSLI